VLSLFQVVNFQCLPDMQDLAVYLEMAKEKRHKYINLPEMGVRKVVFYSLLLVTCSCSKNNSTSDSPYQGNYTGYYYQVIPYPVDPGNVMPTGLFVDSGKISFSVDANGLITGKDSSLIIHKIVPITGSVNSTGQITASAVEYTSSLGGGTRTFGGNIVSKNMSGLWSLESSSANGSGFWSAKSQ
jgi:hypothetical protein